LLDCAVYSLVLLCPKVAGGHPRSLIIDRSDSWFDGVRRDEFAELSEKLVGEQLEFATAAATGASR